LFKDNIKGYGLRIRIKAMIYGRGLRKVFVVNVKSNCLRILHIDMIYS